MLGHDTGTVSAILLATWPIQGLLVLNSMFMHLQVQIELKFFEDRGP